MFEVAAESYDRFMGRYSTQLSPQMAAFARLQAGQRVLDVGCGPGALTAELIGHVGGDAVVAVDPSEPFVDAARARYPDADVRLAAAELLPFADDTFDAVFAQLVVHFMADPVTGLREMARVTRADGVVVVCVWDHAGGQTPLSLFWRVARELNPDARDEGDLPGAREGHLGELLDAAGLRSVAETEFEASVEFASFEEWWEPFTFGVGPAGAYAQSLDGPARETLRAYCRELLPEAPFRLSTRAWAARGLA